jgi:hypothetical protein
MKRTEFAYGRGYCDALFRVAQDLHTQAHAEMHKRGNMDPRGLAFMETYKVITEEATKIELDIERQWRESHPDEPNSAAE